MSLLWLQALGFGLFSALSLPIGAALGICLHPVSETVTARWMAFGAGALVFAVATQLYGEMLFELLLAVAIDDKRGEPCSEVCHMRFKNVLLQNVAGIVGAVLYWALNRLLERVAAAGAPTAPTLEGGLPTAPAVSLVGGAGAGGNQLLDLRSMTTSASLSRSRSASMPTASLAAYRRQMSQSPAWPDAAPSPVASSGAAASGAAGASPIHEVEAQAEGNVALSMWLGLLLDGIPEALMLGFMTNEKVITWEFLIAIFIANFPEAFAGASLLRSQGMSIRKIYAMWFTILFLTGILAMVGSLILPENVIEGSIEEKVRDTSTAILEGLTGGAMLAMIATAMLPEALKGAGESSGILFVSGFVLSVFINAFGARFGGPQGMSE